MKLSKPLQRHARGTRSLRRSAAELAGKLAAERTYEEALRERKALIRELLETGRVTDLIGPLARANGKLRPRERRALHAELDKADPLPPVGLGPHDGSVKRAERHLRFHRRRAAASENALLWVVAAAIGKRRAQARERRKAKKGPTPS